MSKKKNQNIELEQTNPIPENEKPIEVDRTQYTKNEQLAKEHLQVYYDNAYLAERERLDSIFGPLELFDTAKEVKEKIVYKDPDLTNYVEKKLYNKQKKRSIFWCITTCCFLVAAVVFAVLYFMK
ncbi:MAG: hypothetical protein K5765_09550 [Clostridia bacterium]|nr:hypothetical protein [Clostridia bacterium]